MKNMFKTVGLVSGLVLAVNANVHADADIAVQPVGTPTEATTNVDICVVVPEILIFGVGDVGDAIAKLRWTVASADGTLTGNNQTYSGDRGAFTAPAPFSTTVLAEVVSDGGPGASAAGDTANLPVFLFSNNGTDVTITTSTSGGATGGGTADALDNVNVAGQTIPIGDFSQADGGSIIHPDLTTNSSDDTPHTNGIVNLADTWSYTYTPTTIPVAGTYEARITYTAAQP